MYNQGMAFLSQYRKIRKSSGDEMMLAEVDYNFGRAFHQLGAKTPVTQLTAVKFDTQDSIRMLFHIMSVFSRSLRKEEAM